MTIGKQLEEPRADPCAYLNDDCMRHIFSFVGGQCETRKSSRHHKRTKPSKRWKTQKDASLILPPVQRGSYWSVGEAARFCYTLTSVSRNWKRIVENDASGGGAIVSLPLDVNLDEVPDEQGVLEMLSWLCQHKPRIGRFRSHEHWPSLTTELVQIFQVCETSQLTFMELPLNLREHDEQRLLQTVIASQCPSLQELSIFVSASCKESNSQVIGSICPSVVSIPSLNKIEIWLIVNPTQDSVSGDDGRTMNEMVKDLPCIRQLDEPTLDLLSKRKPTELLFEPIMVDCPMKCALGLVTAESFFNKSFS